jgi:hypothetical protein
LNDVDRGGLHQRRDQAGVVSAGRVLHSNQADTPRDAAPARILDTIARVVSELRQAAGAGKLALHQGAHDALQHDLNQLWPTRTTIRFVSASSIMPGRILIFGMTILPLAPSALVVIRTLSKGGSHSAVLTAPATQAME